MYRRFITFPGWLILAITGSGLIALVILSLNRAGLPASSQVNASTLQSGSVTDSPSADLGLRHQLTYNQWVELLSREARVAAEQSPPNLTILAGDSLSLWFPQELLPDTATWLNQGISGETSYGLLRRLQLFDQTRPRMIFVMIGINDLIRGVSEETLLANQQEIVRHLKAAHPSARIVVQSILPHGGRLMLAEESRRWATQTQLPPPWIDRLYNISNEHIRELNRQLAIIAATEKVEYLDLHSYFINAEGDMLTNLTTDGLHLSVQGYEVWRSRLDAFSQSSASLEASGRSN